MADPGKELFDQFLTRGYERILESKESEESEGQYLDFKGLPDLRQAHKTMSKIAVALANSSGGLIVWGVDARAPKPDEARRFNEEEPIRDLSKALIRLNDVTNQIAQNAIPGIVSEKIVKAGEKDTGFLLTYVPESPIKPHQSLTDQRYYYRSGSNSFKMNHSHIEALILAKSSPKMVLHTSVPSLVSGTTWNFSLSLENVGRVPARNIDFMADCSPNLNKFQCTAKQISGDIEAPYIGGNRMYCARLLREFVIYPGNRLPFVDIAVPREFFSVDIVMNCYLYGDNLNSRFKLVIPKESLAAEAHERARFETVFRELDGE